jgi:sulfur-oxidizing protein SoxZ
MASNTIRVRAQLQDGVTTVRALINHPMETGQRKDSKTGQLVPAHFISEVQSEHNGTPIVTALWSVAVSRNPYLSYQFRGANKGDTLKVSWVDNTGDSDSTEVTIE